MNAEPVKVIVALPVSYAWEFVPRRRSSIARKVKRALVVAERLGGCDAVTVILHGCAKTERSVDEPTLVHSEVRRENLDEWVNDWGTMPSAAHRSVLEDPVPANKFEEHFGIAEWFYGRFEPMSLVNEISRITSARKGEKFVILCLASRKGLTEMVRFLARMERPDIFWQVCGDASDIGGSEFWGRENLRRGGVVPNLWARTDSFWTPWLISRGFKKWRKARG
ncbi:hypothetical protein ACFVTY_12405 [Streptomyces sp. NPDC058067]|uniref:hypothetical protein n=1 Tax=Streptomyces sp. NPDC058067 TaxID=3346324 RepID=UPI0036E4647F